MRILLLDNYDSFTYNLVHYIRELVKVPVVVKRNDQISLEAVDEFTHILLSPGPGLPSEAGIMEELIRIYGPSKSIFGVCLGMQAIGEVFGGQLINLEKVFHGLAMPLTIIEKDEMLFQGIPSNIQVGRYHSWVVSQEKFPECLTVTAVDDANRIMALRHKEYNIRGVQFHPESVLTEYGKLMIENWLFPPALRELPELPSFDSDKYDTQSFKHGFLFY